jgi:small subunit ribosomal protein S15
MTVKIRRLQGHMELCPKDKKSKVVLKELIEQRKKFLKYLRRWDYKKFEWLLEKLNIIYRPPPELVYIFYFILNQI